MRTLFLVLGVLGLATASVHTSLAGSVRPLLPADESTIAAPLFMNPGNIVSVREVTLKPGIDPRTFERFVAQEFTPTFEQHVPGVRAFILKGNRGERKAGYAFVLVFDSENTRNFYFPVEHGGEASVQGAALELWRPGQHVILERLFTYVDGISETEGYTDYLVLD